MAEFMMITDLEREMPQKILFNYEELRDYLLGQLRDYTGLVITEDMIPEAKKILANINKTAKSISDRRISIKKQVLKPYDDVKSYLDELENICNSVASGLKKQLDEYEDKRIAEKMSELETYYNGIAGEYANYTTFESIKNKKWVNKGYDIETAKREIASAISDTATAIETIRSFGSKHEAAMLHEYSVSHDINSAIQLSKKLDAIESENVCSEKCEEKATKPAEKCEPDDSELETKNIVVTATKDKIRELLEFLGNGYAFFEM